MKNSYTNRVVKIRFLSAYVKHPNLPSLQIKSATSIGIQPNDRDIAQMAAEIKKYLLEAKLNEAKNDLLNGRHSPKWIKEFCQKILNEPDLPHEIQQAAIDLLEMANSTVKDYIQKVITSANSFLSSESEERRLTTIQTLISLFKDCGDDLETSDYSEINKLLVCLLIQNGEEKNVYFTEQNHKKFRVEYVGLGQLIQQLIDITRDVTSDVTMAIDLHKKILEAHIQLAQSTSFSDQRVVYLAIASEMGSVESSSQLAKEYEENEKRMPILDHIKGTTAAHYYAKKTEQQAVDQQNKDSLLTLGS